MGRKGGHSQQRTQASKGQDYMAGTQNELTWNMGAVLETLHMVFYRPTCQLHSHLRGIS